MKTFLRAAAGAALLLPFMAAPASAQSWRFDIGPNIGYAWYTESVDEEIAGRLVRDARFTAGLIYGGQATLWFSDRFGLRGNVAYANRPLGMVNRPEQTGSAPPGNDDEKIIEDVTLWSFSGDLMFRFTRPVEGRRFLPYLALGAGAKSVNPEGDDVTFTGGGAEIDGVAFDYFGQRILLANKTTLMGLAALGADWRLGRNLALRTEIGDRMWDSPTYRLTLDDALAEGDEDAGEVVQEVYGTVGLHLLLGVEREVVAVAPPPPPPPAPAPAPAPPAEEAITVCVVDPNSPTGLSVVSATYMPATRDTMVMVNGQRQRLSRASGLMLASEADWYVRGEPLAFNVGKQRMEYVTYGTSRLIEANDLAFIGTIRGVPVYANANDVADIREELSELRAAVNQNKSFEQLLEERAELREELDDLEVVYVPLQPTGCVFQGLQRVQEVRKVRGK